MGAPVRPRPPDDGVRALTREDSGGAGGGGARAVAQAIDALRHGWPIRVDDGPVLLPVETATEPAVRADGMLLSAARAATLKLANQRDAAVPHAPALIRGGEPLDLELGRAIADPALDLANPLKGPFRALGLPDAEWPRTALEIARRAGVLPAFVIDPTPDREEPVCVATADLAVGGESSATNVAGLHDGVNAATDCGP